MKFSYSGNQTTEKPKIGRFNLFYVAAFSLEAIDDKERWIEI